MKKSSLENEYLLKINFNDNRPGYASSPYKKNKRGFGWFMKKFFIILIVLALLSTISVGAINFYVIKSTSKYIVQPENAPKSDTMIVLGAGVYPDGTLSPMLSDRVKTANVVSNKNGTEKYILTGDHGRKEYDEVSAMMDRLISKYNVLPENIFLDHAGFSTYESMYRADYIFKVKSAVIVTQKYHLPRAIYIARKKGIDAYGVAADRPESYVGMPKYKFREYFATAKDFVFSLFNFDPTFKGVEHPISGDGTQTHND
ncbi:SanA/YdcF family protein [Oceanirhabdus sp. W0125-5]|uniref:SanA/YdcF family protein n=1 Tax=Oceanirhabdus sp. W0125-5 TaxID=2999116 RepID=UPI0022F2F8B8|nr:ElyC/SanA/YdcF family protein [Oceanirhabdus sp. W0125-5]WBW98585.1 YdcF family protein [Oceanirhabdus sp. W0125-5]